MFITLMFLLCRQGRSICECASRWGVNCELIHIHQFFFVSIFTDLRLIYNCFKFATNTGWTSGHWNISGLSSFKLGLRHWTRRRAWWVKSFQWFQTATMWVCLKWFFSFSYISYFQSWRSFGVHTRGIYAWTSSIRHFKCSRWTRGIWWKSRWEKMYHR